MNKFKDNLRHYRLDRGLTQSNLADFIGITQASISQLEKGIRYPSEEFIYRACGCLGIDKIDLLGAEISSITMGYVVEKLEDKNMLFVNEVNEFIDYLIYRDRKVKDETIS